MRELICTVSGQSAETTKNHKIRISNDRENHQSYGESDKLSHKGLRQEDLLESRSGLPRSFNNVQVPQGGIQAQASRTTGAGPTPSSDGCGSSLTFPRPYETFPHSTPYNASAAHSLHIKANESRYEETYADSCERDSRIVFGAKVHFVIISIALALVGALYFIPPFLAHEVVKMWGAR